MARKTARAKQPGPVPAESKAGTRRQRPVPSVYMVSADHDAENLNRCISKYQALMEAIPDLVFVIQRDGTYIDVRASQPSDLALPVDEIVGRNMAETGFAPEDLRRIRKAIDRALDRRQIQTVEYGLQTIDHYGHFEARIVPLTRDEVLTIVRDVTQSRTQRVKLEETSEQLAHETRSLQEKNTALQEVLGHLESERLKYRAEIAAELSRSLSPILKRMKTTKHADPERDAQQIEAMLQAFLDGDEASFRQRYDALSPRELEICEALKAGRSSKEISEHLNVSVATVHKHREQIRRKLGFQNQRVNLSSFLRLHAPKANT